MTEEQQLLLTLWQRYSRWVDDHNKISFDAGGVPALQALQAYLLKHNIILENGEVKDEPTQVS